MKENNKVRPKVALCVPCYNTITATWLIGFMGFVMRNSEKYNLQFFITEGQPVSRVREELAVSAMSCNPDYILFVDSDNLLPDLALDKLIATMNNKGAGIVSGLYFMKDPPYYPVVREFRSNGFWIVDNLPIGQVIEIAGAGMGMCLIKPDVFKAIERPYFKFSYEKWGRKDILMSEDLYFCRAAMRKGFKIFVDTGCISTHIGGKVELSEYLTFASIRADTKEDREELIQDMMEYTGKTQEEIDYLMMDGPNLMREEWNKINPQTPEEIRTFYKETTNYIYDLAAWHFSTRRQFDVELVTAIQQKTEKDPKFKENPAKILDYGAGFGQNAIMLARAGFDVTLADLDSVTLKFAQFRLNKHKVPYKIWEVDKEEMPPEPKYDFIVSCDVLEHLDEAELIKVVDKLVSLKTKDTEVLMTTSFGRSATHPMHYDATEKTKAAIERLLNKETP